MADSDTDLDERSPKMMAPQESESCETGAVTSCPELSFEEIVRLHQRDVRLFVTRFVGNHAAADDVAQEVFVEVYRSLHKFAGRSSLKAWIFGIARHKIGTWFRQQSRQIRAQGLDIEWDLIQYRAQPWQQESALAIETGQQVDIDAERETMLLRGCMEKLKPSQRTLIQRFYFEGTTAESIGQEQGRGAGAVRMALMRIREALAKCIRQQTARRFSNE